MQYLVCSVWEHHSEEHGIVEGNKAKTECLIIDNNIHICVEFVGTCVYIVVQWLSWWIKATMRGLLLDVL